jgi:hypothetical protein
MGDARAVEPLAAALQDSYWMTREAALEGLARLRDARAVPALLGVLKAHYEDVSPRPIDFGRTNIEMKRGALAALVAIGRPAVDPLIRLLEETAPKPLPEGVPPISERYRRMLGAPDVYAAEALRAITGQDFGTDAAKWRAWWNPPRAPGGGGPAP